jgi:hypothetical protein
MKLLRFILLISLVTVLQGCKKNEVVIESAVYLNCNGQIDRGIIDKSRIRQSVELVKSNVTLTIHKNLIDMKGDGTQIEFASIKTVCSNSDEIKFDSNNCENPSSQIDRLMLMYKNDTDKVLKAKQYEDHHKVFGTYNKISKSLFVEAEDSSCNEDKKSNMNSCGNYTTGKYKCESVEIK